MKPCACLHPARRTTLLRVAVSILVALACDTLRAQSTGTITIDATTPGITIPKTLFGAFFEEINYAGDGGFYGELIRNRSFANSSSPDFWSLVAQDASGWLEKSGTWSIDTTVSPAAYLQNATGHDYRTELSVPGSASWGDYTLSLQARKLGGDEGFLILFHDSDASNFFWWNIGGWGNTAHGIEYSIGGTWKVGPRVAGSVNTDQWYDIRIVIAGTQIQCYLDDVLVQTVTAPGTFTGTIGFSTWNTQAEFRNVVVTGADSQVLYQSDFETQDTVPGRITVDTTKPLNATNAESLALTQYSGTGNVGAANSGYWGIPLTAGSQYDLSLYACAAEGFDGPLTVRLESADGGTIYAETTFASLTADWQRFTATLVPTGSDTSARLVLAIDRPGTVWLDVVSLFPRDTYQGRANGLRPDLAAAVADMTPAFLRFPGGNYIEGNTMTDAFRWKKTIGDIATRPGHWGPWTYSSTDGLGYLEYLEYCEDIGAEPLFDINAGMSLNDVVPLDQMGEYVQDALDAIEYANGDTSTTWGARRAADGHPAPFNMKFIEVGNENGGTNYNNRYALFYDAIKAAYPDIQIVSPVWGGTATSRPLEIIDEHYYSSPATFLSYATKYDSYSRSGPKVFVGEYAVTSGYGTYGNLAAALGEAAFMTGMERNCDVVVMASYAPLFANVNGIQWKPDAIYYDNHQWFGTPAYHVQKMFSGNMGSRLLPLQQAFTLGNVGGIGGVGFSKQGSIGLSTWNTQAEFRNIVVTGADSQVLYQSDFDSTGASEWTTSDSNWSIDTSVTPSAYKQGGNGQDPRAVLSLPGSDTWKNYTLSLQARKLGGSEGFLIMFNLADSNNWLWWNVGGWGNTLDAIEYDINGTKGYNARISGSVTTDQWYDIKIVVSGDHIDCYIDDALVQSFAYPTPVQSVASIADDTREIILKSVNPTDAPISTEIALDGVDAIAPTTRRTTLTSASTSDENSLAAPQNVAPVEDEVDSPSPHFTVTLPAYSVSILRVQLPSLAPQGLTVETGNQQVTLHWEASPGATTYTVQRAYSADGPYTTIASGLMGTSYTDSHLSNGVACYYIVLADNSAGASAASAQATATPVSPPITDAEIASPAMVVDHETHATSMLTAPSVIGHTYQLQYSEDLMSGVWTDVGEPMAGTGQALEFHPTYDPAKPHVFYRVLVTR